MTPLLLRKDEVLNYGPIHVLESDPLPPEQTLKAPGPLAEDRDRLRRKILCTNVVFELLLRGPHVSVIAYKQERLEMATYESDAVVWHLTL